MLSDAQNKLLTQTGPGTPGGKFLRSYWHPIATAEEMPLKGAPMPITIMSEELVLFRDEHGTLGLIQRHCPHRGTDLSYGRIEDGGLRCLYHGWLFDVNGKCLDQPAERKKFCDTVPVTSYPVQEKGGAIWAYLGEGEPPLIPDLEFLTAPEPNRITFRVVQMCNWLQGLESSTDPVHTTFLHRLPLGHKSPRSGNSDIRALRGTEPPEVSTETTKYGTRIFALHDAPEGRRYLRVNNYVYPCGATPSTSTGEIGYQGRWYVPMDDHSHNRFEFIYRHEQPLDKETLRKVRAENVAADVRHVRRPENRYLQSREEMEGETGTFTGMGRYFAAQDAFAIETQGSIQDRTKEYLGSSDMVIVSIRRTLLKAIEQVQAGGEAPGLLRKGSPDPFGEFVCTAGYLEENETPPAFCRRVLSRRAAAE